jgi:twitching motility two-component system response regulator PilH
MFLSERQARFLLGNGQPSRIPSQGPSEQKGYDTPKMCTSEEIIKTAANKVTTADSPAAGLGTILLVEDDYSIRRYLEVILQRSGYEVITASDGLEAMKASLGSNIDLVITDAIMPHLNGYDLCRFLRRHPKLSGLPIVLLSGLEHSSPDVPQNERADVYLAKPVKPSDLTDCLQRLLTQAVAA